MRSLPRVAAGIAQKLLGKIDLKLSYVGRLGERVKQERVYQFVKPDDGRYVVFEKWLCQGVSQFESVSTTNNIKLTTQVGDTTSLPSNEDMSGQENSTDSWWQQVKSYTALFRERVESGVETVKKFLSTLTSDERWGVMLALEQAEPVVFARLVAPD